MKTLEHCRGRGQRRLTTVDRVIFHDITLGVGGAVSCRRQDPAELQPGAVEVFRTMIERHGDCFRAPLPHAAFVRFELDLASKRGAALALFLVDGELASTSALASGQDAEDDRDVLQALQSRILVRFAGTSIEPAFDALAIAGRPVILSVPWPNPKVAPADLRIVADMETCLAAALFHAR